MNDTPRKSGALHPDRVRAARLPRLALGVLGVALFIAAVWLLWGDPAWRLGQAVWPVGLRVGDRALPMGVTRALTWLLLASWLVLGPASLVRAARRWVWLVALLIGVAVLALAGWWWWLLLVFVGFALSFDPRWLPPRVSATGDPELVMYDGGCGLCHRGVRRLALADRDGALFRFAPLEGQTVKRTLTPAQLEALPDSVVVRTGGGKLLTKGDAVVHVMDRLGGWYRVGSWGLRAVPGVLRDWGYDRVAAGRHRWFRKPDGACPMMPAGVAGAVRERFLA